MDFYGAIPNAVPLQQSPYNMTSLASSLPHPTAFAAPQHSFPLRVTSHSALVSAPMGSFPPPPGHPTAPSLSGAPLTSQAVPMTGATHSMEDYGPQIPRLATAPMAPPRPHQQMYPPMYPRMAQGNTSTTAVFK